jgi:hypothetical protein
MIDIPLFIESGFKIEKKTKEIEGQNKTYYLVNSPKLGSFEVNSLNELTKEKYENLVKIIS